MALAREELEGLSVPELTFGERLMLARKRRGISREEMAELLGVTSAAVGHWETDVREPKNVRGTVRRWSEITRAPQNWLLLGEQSATARYLDAAGQSHFFATGPLDDLSPYVQMSLLSSPGPPSPTVHTPAPRVSATVAGTRGVQDGDRRNAA